MNLKNGKAVSAGVSDRKPLKRIDELGRREPMANRLILREILGGSGGNGLDYVSIGGDRFHVPGLRRKLRTF
jgi:hypothetical protein